MKAFSYTAAVKLVNDLHQVKSFAEKYPGISDINIASREFLGYTECLNSCRAFMDNMKNQINADYTPPKYVVSSEINPDFNNGQTTLSKDWVAGEITRIWIFDEAMYKTGHIHAIGQARLYTAEWRREETRSN